jgi:hypothetical protein
MDIFSLRPALYRRATMTPATRLVTQAGQGRGG